jgi:hypothetical protein
MAAAVARLHFPVREWKIKKKTAHSWTCHWSLLFLKAAANSSHKLKTTHLRKF